MGVLHRGHSHIAPLHAGVGTALNEMDARDRRHAQQIVHGVDARLAHHAIDHESMASRINIVPTLVMTLKVQAVGRDHAKQALKRAKRHRGCRHTREAWALAALQMTLVHRRLAIRTLGHRAAERDRMLREFQDRWIALRSTGHSGRHEAGCGQGTAGFG